MFYYKLYYCFIIFIIITFIIIEYCCFILLYVYMYLLLFLIAINLKNISMRQLFYILIFLNLPFYVTLRRKLSYNKCNFNFRFAVATKSSG